MATELISLGTLVTMAQNTVFALPARKVRLFTNSAAPALQQSNDITFATNVAVTLTDGMAELAGGFLRATAVGGALVRIVPV